MNAKEMTALYAQVFPNARAWKPREFTELLDQKTGFVVFDQNVGYAIGRVIADEAELITLAVTPDLHRRGIGTRLLSVFEATARERGATRAFLEVAADNQPANKLYMAANWCESGRRLGYYKCADGSRIDALALEKRLT